ncbi:MAG: peptidoglycan DD-metalloendopeptidase family protein [Clostridiales bacterium]|nr:peptidoglycan DD-metalloendopeptidase family protein [Clostridiales bacterium]
MKTTDNSRTDRKGMKILRALGMIAVAALFCVISTASSSWLSSERVFALGGVPYIVNEVTKKDIEDAKKKRDDAKNQAKAASEKISQLEDQRDDLQGELAKLNAASEEQRAQYEIIYGQLQAALEEKAKALDEFIEAQENLEYQQQLFTDRITIMFEYQNKSTLEVLLESDSIAGFFTNMELITLIADSDAQAIDMLQIALDDAELQAQIKLQYAEDMQAIADEKKKQLDELEALIGTTEATLDDVNTSLDEWEAKEDELEEYAASLDKKVKELQDKYAKEHPARGGSKTTGGVAFSWPTYCTSITSYFGNRVHPVYGTTKFHSGIDIGAGYGDKIMAAASGTVIYVTEPYEGCNKGGSGYGNYCIIDHGNGYSTLYGHARDIYVSEGQWVNAGQSIGEVGSTGTSTGAHLHFEVRLNGDRKNPLNYLP